MQTANNAHATTESGKSFYVQLPDGRLEAIEAAPAVSFEGVEFHPIDLPGLDCEIVYPVVSKHEDAQGAYEIERRAGATHLQALRLAAAGLWVSSIPVIEGSLKGLDMRRFLKVNEAYLLMRLDGQSHSMAEMLATRSFPGVKTDSVFNEGKFSGDSGKVGPEQVWLQEQAKAAGVSTNGKWYCRGLASFPGDPTAWVDSRNDVLRIAREKNLTVQGYVEHKGYQEDPGHDKPIDESIIEAEVDSIAGGHPGVSREDVREQVYALRTGRVDPNPLRVDDAEIDDYE